MDDDYYYMKIKAHEFEMSQQIIIRLEELFKWLILNFSTEIRSP